jgi:glycosyltransferase involved in cell wall biosynthesis
MIAFKEQGHHVISLSQAEGKFIHPFLREQGIDTFSFSLQGNKGPLFFFRHIIYLVLFCYRKRVDIIYSHLESANFTSSLAQYFVKAKVFICRHHIDEARLQGFDKTLFYRLTYKLARHIIAVSNRAVHYMVNVERIPVRKIHKINLAYDFNLYTAPDDDEVKRLRKLNSCAVLLLSAGRLTKFKRLDLSVEILESLVKSGIDARLIILGIGDELQKLKAQTASLGLEARICFPGYVQNVSDYLAASDYLVHPSILESSCVVVKEAGLVEKPVVVCRGVGDFDEYLIHKENGFIVNADHFVKEAVASILESYENKEGLAKTGHRLNLKIKKLFSIENVVVEYDKLNSRA